MNTDSGELWYQITPDKGEAYYLHGFYVIHIPFISTNGYSGVNPVSVLCNTLQYNDEIQKYSVGQLAKGVNAQIVIEAPANLGDDPYRKIATLWWRNTHRRSRKIQQNQENRDIRLDGHRKTAWYFCCNIGHGL